MNHLDKETKSAILVSHTHWDRAWYLSFNEFRLRLVRMIDRIIVMLENNPEFKCFVLDGQVVLVEDYLEIRPEKKAQLYSLIKAGRLVIGPWYVLPDLFLVSSESIIRNLQIGRSISKQWGSGLNVGYVPDPFGHPAQLPQILQGFSIDNFLFMRGMPDTINRLGTLHFNWTSPNGSKVRAYYIKEGYFNAAALGYGHIIGRYDCSTPDLKLATEQIEKAIKALEEFEPKQLFLLNNGVDHMPEQKEIPNILQHVRNNKSDAELSITQGSFSDFMEALLGIDCSYNYEGDLLGNPDHPILSSVYSTRIYIKQQNHTAQSLLEKYVEPTQALLFSLTNREPDTHLTLYSWKKLLQNHPHDDICGCSVDAVHDDNEYRFREVIETSQTMLTEIVEDLAKIGFTKGYQSDLRYRDIWIFNPHPFTHKYRIQTELVFANDDKEHEEKQIPLQKLRGYDSTGRSILFYLIGSKAPYLDAQFIQHTWGRAYEIEFEIEIPAMGYQVVRFVETADVLVESETILRPIQWHQLPNSTDRRITSLIEQKGSIRNANYSIQFTEKGFTLRCKQTGCELENPIQFEYAQDHGDTYSFSRVEQKNYYGKLEQVVKDPLRENCLHIYYQINVPEIKLEPTGRPILQAQPKLIALTIHVELTLNGSKGIDLKVNYRNQAINGRLRILLAIGFETSISYAESHYREVEHSMINEQKPKDFPDRYKKYPGELLYTTHHQIDYCYVSQGDRYSWVANKGLPEYELISFKGHNHFAVTLHRAVGMLSVSNGSIRRPQAGPSIPTPGAQCLGKRTAELSFGSIFGSKEDLVHEAKAFSHPAYHKPIPILHDIPSIGSLPRHYSLLEIQNPVVKISSFYRHINGYFVLRIFNSSDKDQMTRIDVGFEVKQLQKSNLTDRWDKSQSEEMDQQTLFIPLEPFEISTYLFR